MNLEPDPDIDSLTRPRLANVTVKGFKTLYDLSDFQPGSLTVLIGPNGAGKSNFISFFRMLSFSLVSPGQLRLFVGLAGGASAILSSGKSAANEMDASLTLQTNRGTNDYGFRLSQGADDTLVFVNEWFRFNPRE